MNQEERSAYIEKQRERFHELEIREIKRRLKHEQREARNQLLCAQLCVIASLAYLPYTEKPFVFYA